MGAAAILLLLTLTACGAGGGTESERPGEGAAPTDVGQHEALAKQKHLAKPPMQPTTTCPADQIRELERIQAFVSSHSWSQRERLSYGMSTDTDACLVRIRSDQLTSDEEAALQRAGGRHLIIERLPPPRRAPLK